MAKFFEVRKTSEASKYVSYWREVGGVKPASGVLGMMCLTISILLY